MPNFKWWTTASKPQKRLKQIQDAIQDEAVTLLNSRMHAAAAEAKLVVLREAEAELVAQIGSEVTSDA